MQERCQKAIWGPIAISNSPSSLRWTKNWTITKEKYEFKKHLNARVKIIYSNTYNVYCMWTLNAYYKDSCETSQIYSQKHIYNWTVDSRGVNKKSTEHLPMPI